MLDRAVRPGRENVRFELVDWSAAGPLRAAFEEI
jgi:hypothetical protein